MFFVTFDYAPQILLLGSIPAFLGVVSSAFVLLTGMFALTKPEYSTVIGYVGIVFSVVSLMGSLGGLIIGMLLSITGSCLCLAWESDEVEENTPFNWGSESESETDAGESDTDDEDVSGLMNKWR
jgi:hypothetical protein